MVTKRRPRGVTLIELMIVIVIIGVLGSAATFAMAGYANGGESAKLARGVQLAMAQARIDAFAENAQHRLVCTSSGCTLQTATTKGMAAPAGWTSAGRVLAGNHARIWSATASTDVAANRAGAQSSATSTITFFPDGTATPATVYVSDLSANTNKNKFKVYVYPGTGMARLVNNW